MRKFLAFALVTSILLASTNANATIRRVGYYGTVATAIDYASLQAAHDAAKAGDSIYVYPGNWSATFSKRIVLMGYGYFLTGPGGNAGLQNITGSSSASVTLNTGSDSSVFQSLDGLNLAMGSSGVNNITINRCHGTINLNNAVNSGWLITQCYLSALWFGNGTLQKFMINNCIIQQFSFIGTASGQLNNDFINNDISLSSADMQFTSCIFASFIEDAATSTFSYCMGNAADDGFNDNNLPSGNGNKLVTFSTVFVGTSNSSTSTDGAYALATNSPAIGAGSGGTNCGPSGGATPYQLSGLPPLPIFYQFTAPANAVTNPYTITVSVKSNN